MKNRYEKCRNKPSPAVAERKTRMECPSWKSNAGTPIEKTPTEENTALLHLPITDSPE